MSPETAACRPNRLRFPDYPVAGRAGASFKPEHFAAIAAETSFRGFLEVHAENYMGAGGPPHAALAAIRQRFPLSLHGVTMSIGGPEPLDPVHLARFAALIDRYEPALVSEHLAWSTHDDVFFGDLLPLPYTRQTLDHVCAHVSQVQDTIGRPILMENPATYVLFPDSTYAETDFIRQMAQRTGCGLLLDVNNVFVSAANHGFAAMDYLLDFPLDLVGEIHLAGHDEQADDKGRPLLIDTHDRAVADPVWALYDTVIRQCGPIPTLIEWDNSVPDWSVLRDEATSAQRILDLHASRYLLGKRHAALS
jgi:hypothetical protein